MGELRVGLGGNEFRVKYAKLLKHQADISFSYQIEETETSPSSFQRRRKSPLSRFYYLPSFTLYKLLLI